MAVKSDVGSTPDPAYGDSDAAARWDDPKLAAQALLRPSIPFLVDSTTTRSLDRAESGHVAHAPPKRAPAFVITPAAAARWADPRVAALKLLGLLPVDWIEPAGHKPANACDARNDNAIESAGSDERQNAAVRWSDPQIAAQALLAPANRWPGLFVTDPIINSQPSLEAEWVTEWQAADHPRTGTPPNPGWFASVPKSLKIANGKVHANTWFGSKDPIGRISSDGKTVIRNTPGGTNPGGPKEASLQDVGDQANSWWRYPGGWDEWFEAKDAERKRGNRASVPPGGGMGTGAGDKTHGEADAKPVEPTGQNHHPISKKVHDALEEHPKLRGRYKHRDPRLTSRAVDKAAHRGYEDWHRKLDKEVAKWISDNQDATPETFEKWLRWRYSQPDVKVRFPLGF